METTKPVFTIREIAYVGIFAALIAICSWISIPTPWDIAFTLQTFAVCVVVGLLGMKLGTITVCIYILVGLVGLPVFSGFRAGVGTLMGATGGYIIGFVFMALVTGGIIRKQGRSVPVLAAAMIVGLAVCYLFGTVWYVAVYTGGMGFGAALMMCVVPYIIPDLVKIALAILLVRRLYPHMKL